ncbi:hypothetical protein ZIOFF_031279 [Zingiber officinale]|uniref:Uncharacterized protein n=1 Tax=Zingiber officinale TaxID=94328 RepID=A0A8J5GHC3_ZINOF|nr:hypothetical protein ZIOFF_031279 [Zingiber officinale]
MILSTSGGDSESSSSLCSCYAPITVHNNKSGDGRESKKAPSPVNVHGIGPVGQQLPPPPLPSPLKSNLKKPIRVEEQQQQEEEEEEDVMVRDGRRKVSWPDAHGRDLAHVQVFHSRSCVGGRGICSGREILHLQHSVMGVVALEMEAEFCTGHTPCPSQEESGEELSVLPRHTKVIITGNNRTKSVLVGLQGVVKKAVGFGGWHWLVLKNGVEVKLQRNALSVLETPTGDEDEAEIVYTSFYSTSDVGAKEIGCSIS